MKYLQMFFQTGLFLFSFLSIAQEPNWNVEPSQYELSMVYTVVLKFSGTESQNENDKVGAFANGILVGVASPTVYVKPQNRYLAKLIIYSHQVNIPITFKMYNSQTGIISDAVNTVTFISDANIGTIASPYVISDQQLPSPPFLFNNIITPNSDGFNDFLVIQNLDSYTESELSVYDINWTKVFHISNYQNDWSGSELKNGEYYLHFAGDYKNYGNVIYKVKFKIIK